MPRPREDCPRGDAFFVGLAWLVAGRSGSDGRTGSDGVDKAGDGQAYRMRRLKK
jgi:hypothetical protein